MNEDLLLEIYNGYGLSNKGTFDEFKTDMQDQETRKDFFVGYGLDKKGKFEEFEVELGFSQSPEVISAPDEPPSFMGLQFKSDEDKDEPWYLRSLVPTKKANELFDQGAALFGGFAKTASESLTSTPLKAVAIGAQALDRSVMGVEKPIEEYATYQYGQGIENAIDEEVVIPEGTEGGMAHNIGSGFGSAAAIMATGPTGITKSVGSIGTQILNYATQVGKLAVSPAGAVAGIMMGVPEYEAAKQSGASDEEAFKVFAINYGIGQTDAIPLGRMLDRLNKGSGGIVLRTLKNMGVGGIEEAIQEGFQTYLTNKVAQGSYDPKRDPLIGIAESMGYGALIGAILPGGLGIANRVNLGVQAEVNETIDTQTTGNPQVDNSIDTVANEAVQVVREVQEAVQEKPTQPETIVEEVSELDTQSEEKPISALQYSVSDVVEQKIPVETENGIKGTLVMDTGGKITLRDRNYTVDLGNIAEVGAQPFESLGLKPASQSSKPFEGETVTIKVNDALKSQWQVVANAMTKGVRKGKTLVAEQLKKVQEASKQSGMSLKQISAILTKVRNYNPFSGDSGANLSAYIDKVAVDSEYANKVDQARNLQRDIRGNQKNRKKLTVPEQKVFKAFAFLDPTGENVDIDRHLDYAQKLSSVVKPMKSGAKFTPAPLEEINAYTLDHISQMYKSEVGGTATVVDQMINEIKQNRTERALRLRLQNESGEEFTEEMNAMLDNDLIGDRLEKSTKKNEAERQLKTLAETTKKDLPKETPEIIDLDGETYSQEIANEIYSDIQNIDLTLLNPEQLKAYIKAASKIATNGDYGGASQISVLAKSQQDFKILLDKAKKFNLIKIGKAQKKFSSLATLNEAIFGLSEDASVFQLYMGMTGVSDSGDTANQAEARMMEKLEALQKSHPKAFTNDSLFRRGVYKTLVEYNKGDDHNAALVSNKELIERDIITYHARGDHDTASILEKLYKPFKNFTKMTEVKNEMEKLDPQGLEVYNEITSIYKPYAQKIKDYNYFYWNRNAPEVVNYAGKRQYLKLGGTAHGFEFDMSDIERMIQNPHDFSRIAKPKETASAHSRKASVKKNDKGEILPEENFKVLNLNADGTSISGLKQTVFEMESLPHRLQVEYNKLDPRLKTEIFGHKLGNEDAINQANQWYDAMFQKDIGTYTSFVSSSLGKTEGNIHEMDKKVQSALNVMREIGYTATLGGVSQMVKQTTVLANTAAQLHVDAGLMFESIGDMFNGTKSEDVKAFLKGHSVASREQSQSILNIGENIDHRELDKQVKAMVVNMSQGAPVQVYKWLVKYMGGLKFLTKTDANAAQISYMSFYRQHLKRSKEFQGWKEEKNLEKTPSRREAHAYAKQKVDTLQTASNPAEQAASIKSGKIGAQLIKNLVIPYGTFALNQRLRLIGDYKALRYGNPEQRKKAIGDISALAVETVTFKTMSWGTRALMGYGVYALAAAMGVDDERDENEKEQDAYLERERFMGDLLATAVKDWTPTILLAPEQLQDALVWGINGGVLMTYNALNTEEGDEPMTLKEFEKEIGQPLPLYQGKKDKAEEIADLIGVFGAPVSSIIDMKKMTEEAFTDEEYSELTDDERRFMALVATMDFASLFRVAPADVRFAMQREARKISVRRKGTRKEPKGTYEFFLGPVPE